MSSTPTVPSIAPVQNAGDVLPGNQDIGQLLGPIAARANAPLPDPYTQANEVSQPHYHPTAPQRTDRPTNNSPIADNAVDLKRARRQNAVAGLANTISGFGNMIQEKKQNKLKDQLTDVMKAKQNIANATQVANDPNASDTQKQMAANVLAANKKQLNDILSDPKTQKQMAKALDISFVDPEKNKTPEVKAYQEAMKEFKDAEAFNSDNPHEHAVAQMANAGKQPPAMPTTDAAKMGERSVPNMGAPPQPNVSRSSTPYADKAIAKDMPTISTNPLYGPALQQQQAAQKQLAAIIPKLIDNQAKAQIQAYKDKNAAALAEFKQESLNFQIGLRAINSSKLQEQKDKANMARVVARNAAIIFDTKARIMAALKIAEDNRLSKEQQAQIKAGSLMELDKQISTVATSVEKDRANLAQAKDAKDKEQAQLILDNDLMSQHSLQAMRKMKFSAESAETLIGSEKELLDGNQGSGTGESSKIESVGDSESDEDDSDDY